MLTLTPITLSDANAYVAAHHRHHKPVVGHMLVVLSIPLSVLKWTSVMD